MNKQTGSLESSLLLERYVQSMSTTPRGFEPMRPAHSLAAFVCALALLCPSQAHAIGGTVTLPGGVTVTGNADQNGVSGSASAGGNSASANAGPNRVGGSVDASGAVDSVKQAGKSAVDSAGAQRITELNLVLALIKTSNSGFEVAQHACKPGSAPQSNTTYAAVHP